MCHHNYIMDNSIIKNQQMATKFRMFLSSFICLLPGFTGGAAISYAASALPRLMDPNNSKGIIMDEESGSWFVSINYPMQVVGIMAGSYLLNRFGRKPTLIGSSFLLIIGGFVLFMAASYCLLLLGCALYGIAIGMFGPPGYLLVSETCLIKYKGLLGGMNTMLNNIGYLYGLIIGTLLPLSYLPILMVAPTLLFLVLVYFVVESPLWYVQQGRVKDAINSLEILRGPDYYMEPELEELVYLTYSNEPSTISSKLSNIINRNFLLPLTIIWCLMAILVLSGADWICAYSLTLFKQLDLPISNMTRVIFLQFSFTLGFSSAPIIMSSFNRRPHFMFMCSIIFFCLMTLSFLAFSDVASSHQILNWVILICHDILAFAHGACATIPFTLAGEIFPQSLKSLGCSLAISSRYLFAFLNLKMLNMLRSYLGMGGVYFVHGTANLLGLTFVFFFLPETRNKSLTQLQTLFQKMKEY